MNTRAREIRKLSVGPDDVVGTVLMASMTGSQLPAYVFGAGTVVWVVGANKIVKAYGLPDTFRSFAGKLVLFNKEINASRIKVILVKEALGF